jgi:hypothetical protein
MDQITLRDSRNLLAAVAILNENLDLSTLAQRTVAAVTHVLPTDMVTYNEVDLVRRVDHIFIAPDDARLAPGTLNYATLRWRAGTPMMMSRGSSASPRRR